MADHGVFHCLCGREFYQQNTYGKHQRSCKSTKKRLAGALDRAKEIWTQKKQKLDPIPSTLTSAVDEPLVNASSNSHSRVSLPPIVAEASTSSLYSHDRAEVCVISSHQTLQVNSYMGPERA